ncbi:MAG: potassium transporter TrkA, partial [Bacteroidota bacterium]
MKHQASLRQKLQYRFDNLMSGGIIPIIIILLLFSILLTFLITLIVVLVGMNNENKFTLAFWHTFMHVIDQGTITGDGDKTGWGFRIIMLIPTVLGILIVATLVGLITSQIQTIISNLRRGHSLVLEEDHIVILGWSSKIFSVITELIKANNNQDKSCIVILAERDKLEMEYEINQKVEKKGKTRIICRNGNPIDLDDLEIVNHHEAKSIIIISSDESKSDAQNIKGILAIVNHPQRRKKPYH